MAKKILIIDNDPAFVRLVERALTRHGYEVIKAGNRQEGLWLLFHQRPDIVLLGAVMPAMDGWETCRRIRELSDTPIIMLSGQKTGEEDIVRGLDCGADDYLVKPVGNKELVARVHAVLRRTELSSSAVKETTYRDDRLIVDVAERRVIVNGEQVRLTPTEFRLLAFLVANAGHVLTHQRLLEKVWGWEYTDDLDHVRVYIWHLRRKIEAAPAHPRYIVTEPGVGYCFQHPSA